MFQHYLWERGKHCFIWKLILILEGEEKVFKYAKDWKKKKKPLYILPYHYGQDKKLR